MTDEYLQRCRPGFDELGPAPKSARLLKALAVLVIGGFLFAFVTVR